jgi:hypothetical protein
MTCAASLLHTLHAHTIKKQRFEDNEEFRDCEGEG